MTRERAAQFLRDNLLDVINIVLCVFVAAMALFGLFGNNQEYLWAAISSILGLLAFSALKQREILTGLGKSNTLQQSGLKNISTEARFAHH